VNIRSALQRRAREARSWLFDASFPLWSREGVDRHCFAERLDLEHSAMDAETSRVRVQARQTYAFARAGLLGWQPAEARELTEFGLDVLRRQCRRADGLFGRTLHSDGRGLADETADLYDSAFALLAFATAAADGMELPMLMALPDAIEKELHHTKGGFNEALPAPEYRLQNPHMHLFEAYLELVPAANYHEHEETLSVLKMLCLDHFIDPKTGTLGERFTQDWTIPDGDAGAIVEPGHQFEWVWLLDRYARLCREARSDAARALYAFAVSTLDPDGRAIQEVRRDGTPHDASRRTWPQTEALKAHLVMWRDGDELAGQRAIGSFDILMDEYLTPEGGWIDHYSEDGRVLSSSMPASTLYHVVTAFSFLMDIAEA